MTSRSQSGNLMDVMLIAVSPLFYSLIRKLARWWKGWPSTFGSE
jgi:hypothetical protein